MDKSFIILLSLVILSAGCKQKKIEITLRDIKQEEEISPPPPPPPPPKQSFDLSSFNVFIHEEGTIHYYYEPGFTVKDGERTDDSRRINKKFLHRSTASEINKMLRKLEQQGLLKGKEIWFVSESKDQDEIQKVMSAVLADSGITEIWIGTMDEDLLTLLKSGQ